MQAKSKRITTITETGATYRLERLTDAAACRGCAAEHDNHLCSLLPVCYWTGFVGIWKEVPRAS